MWEQLLTIVRAKKSWGKGSTVMRSVYFRIKQFPSIQEIRKLSDRLMGEKTQLTIEVTLQPEDGSAEFIIDVDAEMVNECCHQTYVPRDKGGRGGKSSWVWEITVNVYGRTKFPGFGAKTTVDLEYHVLAQSGRLEAKIAKAA